MKVRSSTTTASIKMRADSLAAGSLLGEKISVATKKGCVFLTHLGQAPFALVETKRGPAVIPDKYEVTSFSDGEYWIGQAKVELEINQSLARATYRFSLSRNREVFSDWKETPTEAYKQCQERLHRKPFLGGGNGQLILGVTYPSLQSRIFATFPEAETLLRSAYSPSRKVRRAVTRQSKKRTSKSESLEEIKCNRVLKQQMQESDLVSCDSSEAREEEEEEEEEDKQKAAVLRQDTFLGNFDEYVFRWKDDTIFDNFVRSPEAPNMDVLNNVVRSISLDNLAPYDFQYFPDLTFDLLSNDLDEDLPKQSVSGAVYPSVSGDLALATHTDGKVDAEKTAETAFWI